MKNRATQEGLQRRQKIAKLVVTELPIPSTARSFPDRIAFSISGVHPFGYFARVRSASKRTFHGRLLEPSQVCRHRITCTFCNLTQCT